MWRYFGSIARGLARCGRGDLPRAIRILERGLDGDMTMSLWLERVTEVASSR